MNRNTLITATATFAVGLLTGALVFSQPAPSSGADPAQSATESPEPAEAVPSPPVESTIAAVRAIDADNEVPESDAEAPEVTVLLARIDDISQGWGRMQAELERLGLDEEALQGDFRSWRQQQRADTHS